MSSRLILATLTTIALLTAACDTSAQDHPTPTPTSPLTKPRPTATQAVENLLPKPKITAAAAARKWADDNRSALARELLTNILGAAAFLDASYTAQVTENTKVKIETPEHLDYTKRLFKVPAEVTSTFTVDKPVIGGTFIATLPISINVDTSSNSLWEMVTGYSVSNEDFSLAKRQTQQPR